MLNLYSSNRQKGFTLIEVLVSLGILAVMSVMSYQAVEVVLGANERSRTDLAEDVKLQRAWQIIGRDLLHMRPRRFADGLGQVEDAYLTNPSEFGVRFSRGGGPMVRSNPSGVRRVDYKINSDQQLQRTSWAITESPRLSDGNTFTLIGGVKNVVFEHLSRSGYSKDWPPINQPLSKYALPRMIRVTIILENERETSRLFPGVVRD